MISKLATCLLEDDFKDKIKSTSDKSELKDYILKNITDQEGENKMKIVGISACPAGLAHTPMAAKALEKAGKELGYDVKMEQQGSMGQVNAITNEEAKSADFVIIASDQKIEGMDRFEGKPVIRVNITTCIKAPQAVLKKCAAAVQNKK